VQEWANERRLRVVRTYDAGESSLLLSTVERCGTALASGSTEERTI
jgi:hypothetical protein